MFSSEPKTPAAAATALVDACTTYLPKLSKQDKTNWKALGVPKSDATALYFNELPQWHQSLLFSHGVASIRDTAKDRGTDYPFVFDNIQTNGLQTALGAVLDNAAIALYVSGVAAHTCASLLDTTSTVHHVLMAINQMDLCLLTRDTATHQEYYKHAAAHLHLAQIQVLSTKASALIRLAYLNALATNGKHLSNELLTIVAEACTTGRTRDRVGQLVLKFNTLSVVKCAKDIADSSQRATLHEQLDNIADCAKQVGLHTDTPFV
jgi:hypothetical protein